MNMHVRRYGVRESHTAGWTDERVEALRKLLAAKLTAGQIANALGGGLTRNGVIGKVHRLGWKLGNKPHVPALDSKIALERRRQANQFNANLSRRKKAAEKKAQAPFRPAPKVADAPDVPLPEAPDTAARVSFFDVQGFQCRFPHGDPRDIGSFLYCGAPKEKGSYCAFHARIAYEPAAPRNKQASASA